MGSTSFDNSYSSDEWRFRFLETTDNKKKRVYGRHVELGEFRGVLDAFYLDEKYPCPNDDDSHPEEGNVWDEIKDNFQRPYIVQVAFELSNHDADNLTASGYRETQIAQYISEQIIDNYEQQGFLAMSATGTFALIYRFRSAILQLERDENFAPFLAEWLFDIKRARDASAEEFPEIVRWLNPAIANNEDQRMAVQKMLAAPDLCLIQGPPGTGKTTVIAEAVYQFALRGKKILIASQSNDAVDNALERLAKSPEIRALRFGQKGRRKRRKISENSRFTEVEALDNYYRAVAAKVDSAWLAPWHELETRVNTYETDLRDARNYDKSLEEQNAILWQLIHSQDEISAQKCSPKTGQV